MDYASANEEKGWELNLLDIQYLKDFEIMEQDFLLLAELSDNDADD